MVGGKCDNTKDNPLENLIYRFSSGLIVIPSQKPTTLVIGEVIFMQM